MYKSPISDDSFITLPFNNNEYVLKNCQDIASKNVRPITTFNISLDDSMFDDFSDSKLPEHYNVTPPDQKKISQTSQTLKETTQVKLLTQSGSTITKLTSWGLSAAVLQEYSARKITTMFPWQCECLLSNSNILSNQKNLIYSAPTSAGKTLVAEILAIKTVLERRKKVMFILPFVSVVREKVLYFQDILGTSGVRVEGYMGSYNPPGGFQNIQIAICTMEKANGLVNRLLEEGNLSSVGAVIVDELHMLGDSSRGYLLELLLTKLLYMSKKDPEISIQIIGMSATLPNLDVVANWLDASLYSTQFRPIPLTEQCQINGSLYNHQMNFLRKLEPLDGIDTDVDNILQLCLEPIKESCSVLIFCPSKQWCESLALQIAEAFYKLGRIATTDLGKMLRSQLNESMIIGLMDQLKSCPVGLDNVLKKTVSFGVAYHHAGLTMDERDIIESAFRTGGLRVLVATSTLSSGVNLPARRVIVRTPRTMGAMMDVLVYRQMIGRAGRMGKDTSGDSVLICKAGDEAIARALMAAELTSVESCLEESGRLKRAILEVISSGVASFERDVELFTKCTLLAKTRADNAAKIEGEIERSMSDPIAESLEFLIRNEFIVKQTDENNETILGPTSLARACLSASMAPDEGLALFSELERARRCIVLETDLHLIYLVTPHSACASWPQIDWMQYLDIWERLMSSMRRVGDLVGVRSAFLLRAIQTGASNKQNNKELIIHKRFFVSLALQELINEVPLSDVSSKYSCNRGLLQSLQQSCATFAGMVTAFSRQLGWASLELLIGQFQDRLHFGVARELLDLMRLPLLNGQRARILHTAGIETLVSLASTSSNALEIILRKATPFVSGRHDENNIKCVWVNYRNEGLSEREAAALLVNDARQFLQLEMGVHAAKWGNNSPEDIPNTGDDGEDENLIEKMRNSSIYDESIVANEITNVSAVKRTAQTIEKSGGSDQLFPDKISDGNKFDSSCDNKENEDNVKDPYHKTVCVDKDVSTLNKTKYIVLREINKASGKKSIQEMELDLNDKLTGFTLLSQSLQSIDIKESSKTPGVEQGEQIDSPILFDDSKESYSIFEADNFTQLIEKASTEESNDSNTSIVSLALHLSVESKESNMDIDNISKEIFDDSFESNLANINFTKNNVTIEVAAKSDSRLFENDSAIEQAFANSFTPLEADQNDIITGDSPKNLYEEPSRVLKRTRLVSDNLLVDQDVLLSSPKKKTKFIANIQQERNEINTTPMQIIEVCKTEAEFKRFSEKLAQQKTVSISLACISLTTPRQAIGLNVVSSKMSSHDVNKYTFRSRKVLGISFYWKNNIAGNVYFLSLQEVQGNPNVDGDEKISSLLRRFFTIRDRLVYIFDAKKQIKILRSCCGISLECSADDPGIADWLVESENKEISLKDMCQRYCPEMELLFKEMKDCNGSGSLGCNIYTSVEPRLRSSLEAFATWELMAQLKQAMMSRSIEVLTCFRTEMNCVRILAEMELAGIGISFNKLQCLSDNLKKHIRGIETFAYRLAGRRFNLSSSSDVAKVLGLSKNSNTSKKRISTSKQVLEQTNRPIAKLVLLWRKLTMALTHLVQPLLRSVGVAADGTRIRGTCVTRTATGRVTMHEPNIQNVSREFHVDYLENCVEMVNCREVFTCREGHVLLAADYCQLELRLLAHLSADSVLCDIMRQKDLDVFMQIAAKWNDIDEKNVTYPLRQNAKKLCYGIIYGMGKKAISEQLSITEEEAIILLESFHKKYMCIKEFISKTVKSCRLVGYIETISGRRRYLPNINHHHASTKSKAERQAVNTAIQGSAADIVKKAMVIIDNRFKEAYATSKPQLVLQIHDELLYEMPERDVRLAATIIKTSMETSVKLSIPFPVKLKIGKSWGSMNEYVFS